MIRNKNKLHKKAKIFNTDQPWKNFRQIRNNLTYAIRKRKLDYLQDLDNRAASKNWWKLVKSFMSNKGSDPDVIPPLKRMELLIIPTKRRRLYFTNSSSTNQLLKTTMMFQMYQNY